MRTPPRPTFALFLAVALIGSCVGGEDPTGLRTVEVGVALQPALIPSAADGTALPVNWIRAIVARQPDGVVLRDERFEVLPSAASWTLEVGVPVAGASVEVIVYLYLLNVDGAGVESVQFSGRTDPITVEAGARLANVDADVVRGPPTNLLVTSVSITSSPGTVYVGETGDFAVSVETSEPTTPEVFWTSLDPDVLTMEDSVGTGVATGTAQVVASAGAFADTVSVAVITAAVDSVRVLPDSADVQVGLTRTYVAALFDVNGNSVLRPVTWTTGNTSIATVNSSSGVVTGVAPGTTTVRATSEGIFDLAIVRVTAVPSGGGTNNWIATSGSWSTGANWSLGRPPAPADTVTITQGGDYTVTLDVSDTVAKVVVGDDVALVMGANSLTMTGTGSGPELEIQATGMLETTTGSIFARGILNAGTLRTLGVTTITADSIRNTGEWRAEGGVQILGTLTGPWFDTDSLLYVGVSAGIQTSVGTAMHYSGGALEGPGSLSFVQGSLMLHQNLVLDSMLLVLLNSSILDEDSEDVTIGVEALVNLFSSATNAAEIGAGTLTVEGVLNVTGPLSRVNAPLDVLELGMVSVVATGAPATLGTQSIDNAGTIVLGGDQEITLGPGALGNILNRDTGVIDVIPFAGTHRAILNGQLQNDGEMLIAGRTRLIRQDEGGNPVGAVHTNGVDATITLLAGGDVHIVLGGIGPTRFENSGTITVYEGATLSVENMSTGEIRAHPGALFEGTGAVDLTGGPPIYPALTGFNRGVIAPGLFGPGVMTWRGTVPMGPGGSIAIDIDGSAAGTEFDQLNVSAQLVLNGNGALDLSWGYSPYMGDRFPIVSYGTRFGNFAAVNLNTPPGISLDTLTVVTASPSVPDTFVVVVTEGPPPPASQVISEWMFDEGAGQTASDVSSFANHGTLGMTTGVESTDPAWLVNGRVGPALSFSGTQKVTVPDHGSLEPPVFTLEAFVRAPATPGAFRYIVSKGGGPSTSTSAAYGLYTGGSGGLVFYTSVNGSSALTYSSTVIPAGTIWNGAWHHVAGVFDGSQVLIYLDGAPMGLPNAASIGYATPQGALTIGALDPGDATYGFVGDIDEVRLTVGVLSPADIAARAARRGVVLSSVIGPTGTDADGIDAPGTAVNLVGTVVNGGPTTLTAGAPVPVTFDFNTFGGLDRTNGFTRPDLLAVRANQKHTGADLILDLNNDGSFTGESPQFGFGLHAARFVTFDLAAIRTGAGLPAGQTFTLSGVAGPADFLPTTGMSLAVLVDGVPAVMHDVGSGSTTSLTFNVPVGSGSGYLTFVALEGLPPTEENGDHGGFARVMLLIP